MIAFPKIFSFFIFLCVFQSFHIHLAVFHSFSFLNIYLIIYFIFKLNRFQSALPCFCLAYEIIRFLWFASAINHKLNNFKLTLYYTIVVGLTSHFAKNSIIFSFTSFPSVCRNLQIVLIPLDFRKLLKSYDFLNKQTFK